MKEGKGSDSSPPCISEDFEDMGEGGESLKKKHFSDR